MIEKPFKIVELDKNVGSGIISTILLKDLTLRSLNDLEIYENILFDPLEDCIKLVTKELNELVF